MRDYIKKIKLLTILIIIAVLFLPFAAFKTYHFLLTPPSKGGEAQIFVIHPGESVQTIAKNLEEKKLIKSSLAFRLLVSRMGIAKKIEAGDFRLLPTMSASEIAQVLTHGAIDIWVTIPEGFRNEEIGEVLGKKIGIGTNDFVQAAEQGYMFPDTYLIPTDATVDQVVKLMRQNYDARVGDILSRSSGRYSEKELLTLASIVERESRTDEERPKIAGVLLNRLAIGMALQADATVQYALGKSKDPNTWWPPVDPADYKIKSPFNTYQSAGLPPGPIANPGLASIKAVVNPESSNYLYYLHDKNGDIHFAQTLEEHNANIAKYL